MAGRRRSLLDRSKPTSSATKDEAAAPEESAPGAPASEEPQPTEPEPVPSLSEAATPAEPEAAAGPTSGPYAEVIAEPTYADKSTGPEADTSPLGWGSSVHEAVDPINDFFDTSTKAPPTPAKATPAKDPPRPVARDTGPAWADPIGVPGPPPLPGLSDRFTPPPAERRTPAGTDDRPAYAPTPPPQPPPDPRAGRRKEITDDDDEPEITEPVPGPFGLPRRVAAVIGLLGLLLVVAVIVIVAQSMGGDPVAPVPTPRPAPVTTVAPAPGGLEVRSTLRNPTGGTDTATPAPEVAPAPVAAPGPTTAPGPAPVAAPAPRPKPAPAVQPPPVVTRTGTLKVRSNRKVLVFVNGRAMGHAPLDLPLVPGDYTLSAALPSRPDTEQTKLIELSAGEIERIDFNF